MNTPLFVNKNTESQPFVMMLRPLSIDDLDIVYNTPIEDFNLCVTESLAFRFAGSLKEGVARELLTAFGIDSHAEKTTAYGSIVNSFVERTGRSLTLVRKITTAHIEACDMRRARTQNKQKRYTERLEAATKKANKSKGEALEKMVDKFQKLLTSEITRSHEKFKEELQEVLVNGNISTSWLDENLSERDKLMVESNDAEIQSIDAELAKLKERRLATRLASKQVKRNAVERHLDRHIGNIDCEELSDIYAGVKSVKTVVKKAIR